MSALEHFVLDGQTDRVTLRAPVGAKKNHNLNYESRNGGKTRTSDAIE